MGGKLHVCERETKRESLGEIEDKRDRLLESTDKMDIKSHILYCDVTVCELSSAHQSLPP